ncbi:unnamed protein product [Bemisia tabaci]|uniref:Uncharacterized protein n=1 Tax=Bemisia tabaci TaxID=7038 RepID=A0A9P0AL17_BEMTA|nr:unnamed protein product [Bemisia tabaci]
MRSQRIISGLILTFFMVLILVYGLPAGSQNKSVDNASFDLDLIRVCVPRLSHRIESVCWPRFSKRNLQNLYDGATFGQNKETNQKGTSKSDKLRVHENFRRKLGDIVEKCCINPCKAPCIIPCIASYCPTL